MRSAIISLPPPVRAPNWRNSLEDTFGFQVEDLPDLRARIRLQADERDYFVAHRLCDRKSAISSATWEPLRRFPRADLESPHADMAMEEVKRRAERNTPEAGLSGLSLALSVLPASQAPQFLEAQLSDVFTAFPDASLYLVRTDALLPQRLGFLRLGFTMHTAPDVDLLDTRPDQVRPLMYQGLTHGLQFAEVLKPLFVAFSPAATGYAMNWPPHSIAIDFGGLMDLRSDPPISRGALYDPYVFGLQVDYPGVDFCAGLNPGHFNSLLGWWIKCLNVAYAIAADPTRFTNSSGEYEVTRHMGWYLTLERLLADLTLVNAHPQESGISRLGTAFDLLDKAESLLGYDSQSSGKGFERLLNRSIMLPLLSRSWTRLPIQLQKRFDEHGKRLFDLVYEEVRAHAFHHRRTPKAIKLRTSTGKLRALPLDHYVPQLARAVRNSSHGLLQQLSGHDLDLVATHDAALPPVLADLSALIAFALLGDVERVIDGRWWTG
jgi:hypothetical protein